MLDIVELAVSDDVLVKDDVMVELTDGVDVTLALCVGVTLGNTGISQHAAFA